MMGQWDCGTLCNGGTEGVKDRWTDGQKVTVGQKDRWKEGQRVRGTEVAKEQKVRGAEGESDEGVRVRGTESGGRIEGQRDGL
jgi:hypothetical protein